MNVKQPNTTTKSRNGYELRADLLGMAKDLITYNNDMKLNEYHIKLENTKEMARAKGESIADSIENFVAETVDAEEVISEAKKFYDFVCDTRIKK
jgi:hypothetical protein|tara:strand:- start:17593 stop:17877 length:285 start_codon:yes stop_codon:yes gene_type:complete